MQVIKFANLALQLETPVVLKELVTAHRYLAELKGIVKTIPNQAILLSTLSLQEAQDSSAIENIITTQDALFKYRLQPETVDLAAKEVSAYADGLMLGFQRVTEQGLLTLQTLLSIQETLENNRAGLRRVSGTVLLNDRTGEVIFEPPSPEKLPDLMSELVNLLHDEETMLDPLIKMAVIHHQFETIHPFYDGNGRTGRILNILYLVKEGLLDSPILYLSRYINHTKADYYRLLQEVRDTGEWQDWVVYILRGIGFTAQQTISLIEAIRDLLQDRKHHIREHHRFYSQDLINNIFRHPYTKVQFLENDLKVSRATATRYLDALADDGVLEKRKLGRENYYLNKALVDLLFNIPSIGVE